MDKATLQNITLDEEDINLFKLQGDYLLKAKAIKYSILPKLNILLEEALTRIRKIYGIEVFKEDSIVHSAPNFREYRKNDLKIDYTEAYIGLGGSRQPIWKGFERDDGKPVKIIPYAFVFYFDELGLRTLFWSLRYDLKLTKKSYEKYFDFLRKNNDYIQTIESVSGMIPNGIYFDKIRPFKDLLDIYSENNFYSIDFASVPISQLNYDRLDAIVNSFVVFFPIYYALLKTAKGEKFDFQGLVSKLKFENIYKDDTEQKISEGITTEKQQMILNNIDGTKFVKAGMRWQVFERDDFKCVACGRSAQDGAILHIDHIVPRSKGGKDEMDNYQTLCHLCNIGKSNKSQANLRGVQS